MSADELQLHQLVGRRVRDGDGRLVGRIEELAAEIELREDGSDYVVTSFDVGRYGALDALAGSLFMQGLLRLVRRAIGYRRYEVAWDELDLSDARRPTLLVDRSALRERPDDTQES